ncbi:tRNA (adenosine(37)-N6)-threonylcarbamoyltransferase complex transferase subunit TsaD [soil metagenome]
MFTLAIETSCDETSAAVLKDKKILSNIISSQLFHTNFGGVVPELASREHTRNITFITDKALKDSGISLNQINLVCATNTPGLIGALLVGLNYGKAIAASTGKPFVPVNHIMAHLYSNMVEIENVDFRNDSIQAPNLPRSGETQPEKYPFLGLIVSGGHTLLILVKGLFEHTILGSTVDDAAGEAFDKGAKMLGLGYPGGPLIDKYAKNGNKSFHKFPLPMIGEKGFDFSFSGSKTSLLYYLKEIGFKTTSDTDGRDQELINDICASYQDSITEILFKKTLKAAKQYGVKEIALSGGVSANSELRTKFLTLQQMGFNIYFPDIKLSSDNAGMIGLTGYLHYIKSIDKEYYKNDSLLTNAIPRLDYENF